MNASFGDGGPAFPNRHQEDDRGNVLQYSDQGMTLRDYFAAKAMQSLIVVVSAGQHCAGASSESVAKGGRTEDKIARDAYAIADAMLKARQG